MQTNKNVDFLFIYLLNFYTKILAKIKNLTKDSNIFVILRVKRTIDNRSNYNTF
jgi:hypothetical protein